MGEQRDHDEGSSSRSPSDGDRCGAAVAGGDLEERLMKALGGEDGEDLLLDRRDMESVLLPWLRALDAQVLGACRADERLKPLLSVNAPDGVAGDRLMIQLVQHFEASEVGMLARCLCLPLVSIRVGKVSKQGKFLCPTCVRGHLSLVLLPSSHMRISFVGDDGCLERVALVRRDSENSVASIQEISEDSSGRSFVLNLPRSQAVYFWCSEKSNVRGHDLLSKMKDLLRRRPSLSHITGISETRLNLFASHIQSQCLDLGDGVTETAEFSPKNSSCPSELDCGGQPLSEMSRSFRSRPANPHTTKLHASSLSPRSTICKDGMQRNSTATNVAAREKPRRRGDARTSPVTIRNQSIPPAYVSCSASPSASMGPSEEEELSVLGKPPSFEDPTAPPFLSLPLASLLPSSHQIPLSKKHATSSQFSPYYCWCPPCAPASQYGMEAVSCPPPIGSPEINWIPPSYVLQPKKPPANITDLSILDLPACLPDPLFRLSLPVTSLVTVPIAQQVPIFAPLMSDPIVHVPVIDVCSSGQGYLVSAGPAMSTSLPPLPLLPKAPNAALSPKSQLILENTAKETLRMLIATAPTPSSPNLATAPLPSICTSKAEDNLPNLSGDECCFRVGFDDDCVGVSDPFALLESSCSADSDEASCAEED